MMVRRSDAGRLVALTAVAAVASTWLAIGGLTDARASDATSDADVMSIADCFSVEIVARRFAPAVSTENLTEGDRAALGAFLRRGHDALGGATSGLSSRLASWYGSRDVIEQVLREGGLQGYFRRELRGVGSAWCSLLDEPGGTAPSELKRHYAAASSLSVVITPPVVEKVKNMPLDHREIFVVSKLAAPIAAERTARVALDLRTLLIAGGIRAVNDARTAGEQTIGGRVLQILEREHAYWSEIY